MILISNDRTSASKKLNRMALIGILTVSTTAFEITKEKFDDFLQTDLAKEGCVQILFNCLTLFDMGGGGMMAPQNVFDHCAETLWRRKLKLGDF